MATTILNYVTASEITNPRPIAFWCNFWCKGTYSEYLVSFWFWFEFQCHGTKITVGHGS